VTRLHTALIIAGVVLLGGSACGLSRLAAGQPVSKKELGLARTMVPTFTPSPDWTATPTSTSTLTPTPKVTDTSTPAPSATSTPQPTGTTRPTGSPKPAAPTATPTSAAPAATATAALDFVVAKQDVMPVIENGGCQGRHSIFVTVVDANNQPIDGLLVSDKDNTVSFVTGDKGPGQVTFDLWRNGYDLYVKSDKSGQSVRSEMTRHLSSDKPEISDMIKGGVCKDEAECQTKIAKFSYCFGHYAYEVTFRRTY
jgi:hypothetical protein